MDLPERVRRERELRGLSVRRAAELGGTSNETWGKYERGLTGLSPKVRTAVARAFEWPMDWPEHPPRERRGAVEPQTDAVSRLRSEVEALAHQVQKQAYALSSLTAAVEALARRVSEGPVP